VVGRLLGREADDEVRRQCPVVQLVVQRLDDLQILRNGVLPAHIGQHVVAAGLDRRVDEVVQFVVFGKHRCEFLTDAVESLRVRHADTNSEIAVDVGADAVE